MQIIWKDVVGFEVYYEVNNNGVVRTKERVITISCHQKFTRTHSIKSKEKKQRIGKNGYVTVALVINDVTKNTYLHRIIAEAFVPNPNNYSVVNHINGLKTDNRIENLEWCTSSHNNKHAIDNGLRTAANSCLDKEVSLKILELKKSGKTQKEIAEHLNLSISTVGGFLRGRSYKNL